MELTEEIFEKIYERANEFCIAKYGSLPDEISVQDGYIQASYITWRCGDREEEVHSIYAENLSEDLDKLYVARQLKQAEDKIEEDRLRAIRFKKEKELLAKQRHSEYLRLKKEFE